MRNKYGGICCVCGEWVKPEDGYFTHISKNMRQYLPNVTKGKRWFVHHDFHDFPKRESEFFQAELEKTE